MVNKPEIDIIPTRKAGPNIFLIVPKQDYNDAQYVKFLCDLFLFSTFYCANEGKMFKNLIILITRRDADHILQPFVKRDFDILRILNLPIPA